MVLNNFFCNPYRIIEVKENASEVSNQILALRLLTTTLPQSNLPPDQQTAVQSRLFGLIGHTALMCNIDGTHYGDQVT